MKILAVLGSPRKGGNTEFLANVVCESARNRGAKIEKVRLSRLNIHGCLGCAACKKNGVCCQKDDMIELADKLGNADVWLLATPVYWWGPTSQMKAFIDRWYVLQYGPHPELIAGRRAALVSCFEDAMENATPHLMGMLKNSVAYLGLKWAGEVLAQAHSRGEVKDRPEALLAAAELGVSLSRS